jgi:hypothetical protein
MHPGKVGRELAVSQSARGQRGGVPTTASAVVVLERRDDECVNHLARRCSRSCICLVHRDALGSLIDDGGRRAGSAIGAWQIDRASVLWRCWVVTAAALGFMLVDQREPNSRCGEVVARTRAG